MKPIVRAWIGPVAVWVVAALLATACAPILPEPEPENVPAPGPAAAAMDAPADASTELASIAAAPVRHPFQDQVLYFVMPDRFANGDPNNDTGDINGGRLDHGFDPTDKGFYHGGDLAGLIDKLDYLEALGVTSIWMTPMFVNQPVQGSGDDISAAYHGYWITDFTRFDPHFGTNEELEALIEEADTRGISIFFDIITNHTADVLKTEEGQYAYRSKADYPYVDADGKPFDDRDYVGDPDFPSLDAERSFPYTPVYATAGDETIKAPAWLNDPIYYHNRGNTTFSGEDSLYGDFFGLDDLFTEHPDVVNGLIDIYGTWVEEYGIAGFRIDTVKHVNIEFWQAFSGAINARAAAAGKEDFFAFGEVFSGDPELLSYFSNQTEMPAVLDFAYQENIRKYVSNGESARNLAGLFAQDDLYTDADSNAYMLPSFTGNHDRGRFGHFLIADGGGKVSDDELLARTRLAHAMMYFARGVPVIYYGDEQGFTGRGNDKDARQDMFPSQVDEYADPAINSQIGAGGTPADDNFDVGHPIYMALADFAQVYQAHEALRQGAQIHRYAADGPGIYAFSRIDRDEQIEYVVAFNNSDTLQNATFDVYLADADYQLLLENDAEEMVTSDADGQLTVNVPAVDFVIYRASVPLTAMSDRSTPAITIVSPPSGEEHELTSTWLDGFAVPDRLEVRAELDRENVLVEVTFAVRQSGSDDWSTIGVDDNPPYRVFYDAGAWPDGTDLDFFAVVNDLNGGYNADEVTGVTVRSESNVTNDNAYAYAVIHYLRPDGDYGDHTTGEFDDYWGLHLWGDAIDPADATEWTTPKPFLGETDEGRFAWVALQDPSQPLNFIVHRGDNKDGTQADRSFVPSRDGPAIWLKQDDGEFYRSQAAAQGYVTIHYQRADEMYDGWGLHLWGDAIGDGVETEWTSPRPFDGVDDFGAYWHVPIKDADAPVNFIVHRGDDKDPGPDQRMVPLEGAHAYILSGDETVYRKQGDAENFVTIHYHRPAGDYGDPASENFEDFWGLHTWAAAVDSGWATPRKPDAQDTFGNVYRVPLNDRSRELGYIHHRGDIKDPGPDQFLDVAEQGFEVWQLQGAEPEQPFLPVFDGGQEAGDR